jgi:hypothetical protein
MKDEVTSDDIDLVIQSLRYYKMYIQNDKAPRDPQERQQRLQRVELLTAKNERAA